MSKLSDLLGGMLRSNTMQFNFGAAILWFLGALSESKLLTDNPEWMAILGGVTAIVNIFLRAKTKKPLAER